MIRVPLLRLLLALCALLIGACGANSGGVRDKTPGSPQFRLPCRLGRRVHLPQRPRIHPAQASPISSVSS